MNKIEFRDIFALLCETYGKEPTKVLMSAYYMVLEDLTVEEFKSAIKSILVSRKYNSMPLPADILECVNGSADDNALIALKVLENEMARSGAYNSVCFKDRNIMTAVSNMGGWIGLCRTTDDEWKFKKKEFLDLYKALSKSPNRLNEVAYLKGLNEHNNRNNGFDDDADNEDVKLIGFDEVKNKTVKVKQIGELRQVLKLDAPKEQNQVMQLISKKH